MGTKITALGAIPEVANVDVLPIVDLTDTTTKKATITQIEARFTADGFLSALDNISELTNDSGYITVSDFSNDGENAGVNRDLGNLDAFALSFITSGVGRINIEAGGNVGIGTSTPSEVLEVVGNTKISGNITQTDAAAETSLANGDIYIDSVAAAGIPAMWLNQTGAKTLTNASFWQTGTLQGHSVATGGQFQFRINNQASQGMTLKEPNGNVHAAYLSVGNTSLTNKYISLGGGQYGLGIRSGALGINTLSTGKIFFSGYDGSTTPTDLMVIDAASGNVGIGTVTPTAKLNVVGTTYLNGNVGIGISPNLGVTQYVKGNVGDTFTCLIETSANDGKLYVYENGRIDIQGKHADSRWSVGGLINNNWKFVATGTAGVSGVSLLQTSTGQSFIDLQESGDLNIIALGGGSSIGLGAANADLSFLRIAGGTVDKSSLTILTGVRKTIPTAGDIIFDGTNFEGYNGSAWVTLG